MHPEQVVGSLPLPNQWTKLTIDTEKLGLPPGATIQEWKVGLFNGVCLLDGVRLIGTAPFANDPRLDLVRWWTTRKDKDTPTADGHVNEALKGWAGKRNRQVAIGGCSSFLPGFCVECDR